MYGADIYTVEQNATTEQWFAVDRFSKGTLTPARDAEQNVRLLDIQASSKYVRALITRPLETCDQFDASIKPDIAQFVIYAWGSGSLSYHGTKNRGNAQVQFVPKPNSKKKD